MQTTSQSSSMPAALPPGAATAAVAGALKVLVFTVAETTYCIDVSDVREIVGMQRITPVPGTPHHVLGVINLRGRVVPVVDVRLRFGLPQCEFGERSCVIVVRVRGNDVGLAIDAVDEVAEIPYAQIDEPPTLSGGGNDASFVTGIARVSAGVRVLLGADRLLTDDALGGFTGAMP